MSKWIKYALVFTLLLAIFNITVALLGTAALMAWEAWA